MRRGSRNARWSNWHEVSERRPHEDRNLSYVRLPDYETVKADKHAYAIASRLFHLESNPANARALVQRHGDRDVWINPPPLPLSTAELDYIYELPYARAAPELSRHKDPGLGDDPLFDQHHARLLRRVHLLFDHRA
jgi:radical SAM superfamily enzyme YgiQ (UPF0313 family)